MARYERSGRVAEEKDSIQLVLRRPADAAVVAGGPVVRQAVLRNTGRRYKPAASAHTHPARKGKANLEKKFNNRWRCALGFRVC